MRVFVETDVVIAVAVPEGDAGCTSAVRDTVTCGVAFAAGVVRLSETAKYEKPGVSEL